MLITFKRRHIFTSKQISSFFFRNALEEMILQTKQGKLWHFPVDNEQGKNFCLKD